MSEPTETSNDGVHLPKPFFPRPSKRDEFGNYTPVDPFDTSFKLLVGSGFLLGGMHLRRLIQLRKGSQRPGLAKYIGLFQTTKRQLIGIPLAVSSYAFLHDCLMNIYEEETATNEFISASTAAFIGLSIIGRTPPVSKTLGISLSIGLFYGWARWAGGFEGLKENSHAKMKQDGKIRPLEETQGDVRDDRQGFWEGVYRRPLSQTVEDLGEGRGILKP